MLQIRFKSAVFYDPIVKKLDKRLKDRLIGGFGAAGGTFIFGTLLIYLASPGDRSFWPLSLGIGVLGAVFLAIAFFVRKKH